jgi:hypothetical protein
MMILAGLVSSCTSPAKRAQARAALEAEKNTAIQQVKEIVNQPVQRFTLRDDMNAAVFRPGWFHQGASRPAYHVVDVRQTRETPYAKFEFVTSDVTPGVAFYGAELEFNSMTKYFYEDYSSPKKKLTDAEMEEVNRLYRIIAHCDEELEQYQ